jgi:hypothetical protein
MGWKFESHSFHIVFCLSREGMVIGMKRLCYGTFGTMFRELSHTPKSLQTEINAAMLDLIDPHDEARNSSQASRLFNCEQGINKAVKIKAQNIKPNTAAEFAENFNNKVIPMIPQENRVRLLLALQDFILSDDNISSMTVIDRINGVRKINLCDAGIPVDWESFLAGVLLYVVCEVDNKVGKESLSILNDDYFGSITEDYLENLRKSVSSQNVGAGIGNSNRRWLPKTKIVVACLCGIFIIFAFTIIFIIKDNPSKTLEFEPNDVQKGEFDVSETNASPEPPSNEPKNPPEENFPKGDFEPHSYLQENQRELFPLYDDTDEIPIDDFENAKNACIDGLLKSEQFYVVPFDRDELASELNKSAEYARNARTEALHDKIVSDYSNKKTGLDETIGAYSALISQQERAVRISKDLTGGGVLENLIVLIARNCFELGRLYESDNETEHAFVQYIKSIEHYIYAYNLCRSFGMSDDKIQNKYSIHYWIAQNFMYIGDMGRSTVDFRADSFVSSRSFYELFNERLLTFPNGTTQRLRAYSMFFTAQSCHKTAIALRGRNGKFPSDAIVYIESAKKYYLDAERDASLPQKQKDYCIAAIKQLDRHLENTSGGSL